ncbi:MAG: hypothetical protein JNJ54_32810 [Myxococcaceae bacterium]|nr:hypothetical protein [Myxococcaceae bacterium]
MAVLVLARSSHAEPPPAMEPRKAGEVLAALKSTKAPAATLSSVRWFLEVTHGTVVQAPMGSPPSTLGPWGDNGPLLEAERALGDCAPLGEADAKAALALLAEYGAALPPALRGVALAQSGKVDEAAALYRETTLSMLPAGACPGEHPMYSHRRASRMQRQAACLERWEPKADHAAVKKAVERAKACAANNHAVG